MLFFSEIVPKTLGTAYWKQLAPITGILLTYLVKILILIIIPIQVLKSILPKGSNTLVTRDDVVAIVDLGEEEGILEEDEETVIHNLLKLRDINVSEIKTEFSEEFKDEFTRECVKNARVNSSILLPEKYCSCMLDKIMTKYNSELDTGNMTMNDVTELAKSCAI